MPQIRIKNGPQKGKIIPIDGSSPIVIGRDPSAHLQIIDKGVSREHAEIFRVGEMVFIRDLGSRNGTFVNDEQLEEELLREGDTVRVGNTQMVFESERRAAEGRGGLQFEESGEFKTSLDLKVDDLFVGESASSARENEQFIAVCQATQVLNTEHDEKQLFEKLMDLIQDNIPADYIYLFLRDSESGAIVPRATRQKGTGSAVPISRTILLRVITESRAILTADAMQDDRFKTGDSIVLHQIRSVLCVPIQAGEKAVGAIYAVNARMAETFEQVDLQMLTAIGAQLAAALEHKIKVKSHRDLFVRLLGRMMRLYEKAPAGAEGHAERVAGYCEAIASELGIGQDDLLQVVLAGLLHDIGKLPKPAEPKDAAKSDLAAHAVRGEEMLRDVPGLQKVLTFVLDHHERYDGKGGPNGLKGESIPIGARIVAVANAFDHLLFDGKDPKTAHDAGAIRQAFTDLTAEAGEAFDMAVVRALIVAYRHGLLLGPPPSTDGIPTAKPAPDASDSDTEDGPDDSSESSKRAVAARDEGSSVTRRRKAKDPKK